MDDRTLAAEMVKRAPLFPAAVALAAGIALAAVWPVAWEAGFGLALLLGVLAGVFPKRRKGWVAGLWFLLGASLLSYRMEVRPPDDLRLVLSGQPELVTVRGELAEDPEQRVLNQDARVRHRTTARLRVREIVRGEHAMPARGQLAVSTPGHVGEEFVAGARVEIDGAVEAPRGPVAPGLFDFERYLRWQGIHFVLRAESTNDWRLARAAEGGSAAGLYRRFNTWARATLQQGIPEDESTRLLWAMTLGWKPGLTTEISEPFMRTGTLHVFAISGLHIALVAWMLLKFLGWFGVPRKWAGLVVLPLIWFYTGATGWQSSAIRSTIMSSVLIGGWLFRRPTDLLNSLAASAVLIFLWQPEQLFQAGFQLSFALILTFVIWPEIGLGGSWPDPAPWLGWTSEPRKPGDFDPTEFGLAFREMSRPARAWVRFLAWVYAVMTRRDPFLPDALRFPRLRALEPWLAPFSSLVFVIFESPHMLVDWVFRRRKPHGLWVQARLCGWVDSLAAWLIGAINISTASFFGALPLTAYYFHTLSFSSVFANLLIVPASGWALGLSMGSLLLGFVPAAPGWLNPLSHEIMAWMVWFCRWCEQWRWTYMYVEQPGALAMIVYTVALSGVWLGWWFNGTRRSVAAGCVVILLATGMIGRAVWRESKTRQITVLPARGAPVFIDWPGAKNDLLLDCGREREAATVLKPFLRAQGVDRLPTVVITHGDVDHVEGHGRLREAFRFATTITSPARSRSTAYRALEQELEAGPGQWLRLAKGDRMADGWEILHPGRGQDFGRAEDDVMVIACAVGGVRVLLLSDLGRTGRAHLLAAHPELQTDVLICALEAGGQPPDEDVLRQLRPQVVIATDAGELHANRERRAWLGRFREQGIPLLFTSEAGAVTISFEEGAAVVRGMTGSLGLVAHRPGNPSP